MFAQDLRITVRRQGNKRVVSVMCSDYRVLEAIKELLTKERSETDKYQIRITAEFLEIEAFDDELEAIKVATKIVRHLLQNRWVHSNKPFYTVWQWFQKELDADSD